MPNTLLLVSSFGKFFSSMALCDVMKGGTPCMGIFPGRMHPRTHRPGVCFPKASLANYGGKFH